MNKVTSLDEVNECIHTNRVVLLYISRQNCSVCHALLPQIEEVLHDFPTIASIFIDADELPEIAGAFTVFTVPTILVFLDGKEMIRKSRFIPIDPLQSELKKVFNYL